MDWKLKKIKVSELREWEKNPRALTEKGLKDLRKSIEKFGIAEPLVCNADLTICGGHGRLKIIKELGIKEVDCYLPDKKLTTKQFEELNIRLNKNIAGNWDYDLLASGFDLPDLLSWGFEERDLDLDKWGGMDEEKLDDVPEAQKEAVAKLGDIFAIDGKHRVMCGDSTDSGHVGALMGEIRADMVFTDPPYGVSYADKNKYLNTISRGNCIQTEIKNDHMSIDDTADKLIYPAFCQIKNILNDYGVYYITAPQGGELLMMMMMMMMKADIPLRHMIIWKKNNHVLGRTDYNYKHEPILYGWVNRHKFYGGGEQKFSVWDFDKPHKSDLHPTMKPTKLVCNAILNSTQSGNNTVADLFLGSGTTLIACAQTNRICYGMELDPIYIDVILRRYKNLYPDSKFECLTREFDFEKLFNV